jgi:hypothetical protein
MKNAQQYWSKHIAAIKRQGTTTSAYARQHQLALASLYHWQRRLRFTQTLGAGFESAAAPSRPSKFIALTVSDSLIGRPPSSTQCTLVLAGGMRLEMNALPDPQWLAAVGRSNQGAC